MMGKKKRLENLVLLPEQLSPDVAKLVLGEYEM
jgi:hypothetical protein